MNYEKYREMLIKEKMRILKKLKNEVKDEERVGTNWHEPKDFEDWANLALSEDLRYKLAERDLNLLREIERALEKIAKGNYGKCEKCGKSISEERLSILPWTRYCAECAKKLCAS